MFLAKLDAGYDCMYGIIRTFIAFYTIYTSCISLETRVSVLHFYRKQCRSISFSYRVVLLQTNAVEFSEMDAENRFQH